MESVLNNVCNKVKEKCVIILYFDYRATCILISNFQCMHWLSSKFQAVTVKFLFFALKYF